MEAEASYRRWTTIILCLSRALCVGTQSSSPHNYTDIHVYAHGRHPAKPIIHNRPRRESNKEWTAMTSTGGFANNETSSWADMSMTLEHTTDDGSVSNLSLATRPDKHVDASSSDVSNETRGEHSTEVDNLNNTSEISTSVSPRQTVTQINIPFSTNEPTGIQKNNQTWSSDDDVGNGTFTGSHISITVPTVSGIGTISTTAKSKEKNKEGVFSQKAVDDVWYVCHGILGSVIELVGIVGNVMCIIVLSHSDMRSSTSILLTSLAVYDIIVLTSYFFMISLQQIFKQTRFYDSFLESFHKPSYPVWFSIASIAFMGSSYTTVAISIERSIVVSFPLKASIWCTEIRARFVAGFVFLLAALYNIPRYMVFNLQTIWDEKRQKTFIIPTKTDFSKSSFYGNIYSVQMNISIKVFLPLTILITCSSLMLRAVLGKRKVRRILQQNATSSNHSRFTAMVAAVMVFSLMSLLTGTAEVILLRIHDTQFSEADSCEIHCAAMSAVSELIAVLNSGINFLLFCFFGSKFRQVFKKRFCAKQCKYSSGVVAAKGQSLSKRTSIESTRSTQTSNSVNGNPATCQPY